MYDEYHLSRCDAMEWLAANYPEFPDYMPDVPQAAKWISEPMFKNWRFVVLSDLRLVFANCVSPCVTKQDMARIRQLIPQ